MRTVAERVKEINSATGVLIPFAARRVYRVSHALRAEQNIHKQLVEYRIRPDREFFRMSFGDAAVFVEKFIDSERLRQRHRGSLIWFDSDKRYGFISIAGQQEDAFFYALQVAPDSVSRLRPGAECEFALGRRPQGLCALDVMFLKAKES